MKPRRPYFLDLAAIRLPIGGMVSILHRMTGAGLALAVPLLLYLFMLSLRSPWYFHRIGEFFSGFIGWVVSLGLIWALLHHFLAGLRHLGFDLGLGEEKAAARKTAWASLLGAIVLTALVALWRLA